MKCTVGWVKRHSDIKSSFRVYLRHSYVLNNHTYKIIYLKKNFHSMRSYLGLDIWLYVFDTLKTLFGLYNYKI